MAHPMAHPSVHPVEQPWLHSPPCAPWWQFGRAHPWTGMGFSRPFCRGTKPSVCLVRIKACGTSGCSGSPQVLYPSPLSSCSVLSHGIASHLMKLNPLSFPHCCSVLLLPPSYRAVRLQTMTAQLPPPGGSSLIPEIALNSQKYSESFLPFLIQYLCKLIYLF